MKKSFSKKLIVLSIFLILLIGFIILLPKRNNVTLDSVSLRELINNDSGMFAIMIETSDDVYETYSGNEWPTGMVLNEENSVCVDSDGNTMEDVLSFGSGVAIVNTGVTTYCYLYFDIFSCEEGSSFSSCLVSTAAVDSTLILHESGCNNGCAEDGKYRYSGGGTSSSNEVNNYVCFGTNDLDTCLADTDTYLFRIIEVDLDTGNVKLVKATILPGSNDYSSYTGNGDLYYWNSTDGTSDTAVMYGSNYNYWAVDDTLYATLATDLNTTYLNTIDSEWQNIIATYNWNIAGSGNHSELVKTRYDAETSETASFKIGLMNSYDYGYAAESSYWTTSGGVYTYNDGAYLYDWLFLGKYEWTITSRSSHTYFAFYVISSGWINNYSVYSSSYAVRPSFYLSSNVTYISGNGEIDSPYIISWN